MNGKTVFSMGVLLCLMSLASDGAAADATGQVVELWPGQIPDGVRNMGAEKVVMSPALDRTQVEVPESTRMVTNVSRPTLTVCPPPQDAHTGTAILICPGGGYWNISDAAHSVVAYLALKRAGVSAELHIYADSAHDFGVRPNDRTCSTWTQSCAAWLRQQGWLTKRGGHGP